MLLYAVRHWLAHFLSWNTGHCHAFWRDGHLLMAFICDGCGEMQGVREIPESIYGHQRW
jgi:hypothetical protein